MMSKYDHYCRQWSSSSTCRTASWSAIWETVLWRIGTIVLVRLTDIQGYLDRSGLGPPDYYCRIASCFRTSFCPYPLLYTASEHRPLCRFEASEAQMKKSYIYSSPPLLWLCLCDGRRSCISTSWKCLPYAGNRCNWWCQLCSESTLLWLFFLLNDSRLWM